MRQQFLCLVVCLSIGLLLLGCAKKENQVLAKVGKRPITISQLNERIKGMKFSSPEEELQKKGDILNGMVNDELMVAAALEQGLDKDPEIVQRLHVVERAALLEHLYNKEIVEKSKPSEKEMTAYYDRLGWENKVCHILVGTEKEAQEIYQQLKQGADFAQLAQEKSMDPATKTKGGDLGYFTWGKMVSPFQDTAWAMEVGEISRPVNTSFGWHIIKLDDRRTTDKKDFAEEKERIERTLTGERSKKLSEEYLTALKDKANIQINSETAQLLLNKLLARQTSPQDFTDQEKSTPLVTFQDGKWTVEDFMTEYRNIPSMYQPRVRDMNDLDALVRNIITGTLLERDARKKGLQSDKAVVEKIRFDRDRTLLQAFQKKGIPADTMMTEDQIMAYYQEHIDQYTVLAQAKVQEIQLDSEDEATKVLKQLRSGANFAALAKEKSTRTWAAKQNGDLGWLDKRRYPNLSEVALEMKVGELAGPIQDGNKYSVIKVLEKKPAAPRPIEEVRENIRGVLFRERNEAATKKWLEDMRQKVGVQIFEKVLESTIAQPEKQAA